MNLLTLYMYSVYKPGLLVPLLCFNHSTTHVWPVNQPILVVRLTFYLLVQIISLRRIIADYNTMQLLIEQHMPASV